MNQKGKNDFKASKVSKEAKYGIISTQWNKFVVDVMLENAVHELTSQGVDPKNIKKIEVPGSYELPIAAQKMLEKNVDAVIALGAVIKGETPHFEFVSSSCANGLTRVSLDAKKPVLFGVLTTETEEQAIERADPERGNKGGEVAQSAMELLEKLSSL
ncbi:MAG: 6,7-dimethyl-8-ribityllumazine synthase [Gammaproteobacteria bacterium]|nr:MAG: 6,7-dimethyl-8-ribityllumazine synthase [Gammaproteobacteria bacterium]|tara:strand:+ start:4126 stop:4599 length:474 start_codon:yes stop_codon:yes gene_type:complete